MEWSSYLVEVIEGEREKERNGEIAYLRIKSQESVDYRKQTGALAVPVTTEYQ